MEDSIFDLMNRKTAKPNTAIPKKPGATAEDCLAKGQTANPQGFPLQNPEECGPGAEVAQLPQNQREAHTRPRYGI